MANAAFGWVDGVSTGTLAAGAEATGFPITNLQNPHGAPAWGWQTPAGVVKNDQGAWFTIDKGYTGLDRAFSLHGTNLTPTAFDADGNMVSGAQICWRVWQLPDMQDDSLAYSSGWMPAGVAPGYKQHVHVAPADVLGRYVRCDIWDSGNTDGFINIPQAFVGPFWQPSKNISWDSAMTRSATAPQNQTRGGQTYVSFQFSARGWKVNIQAIPKSEVWGRVAELDRVSRFGGNVLFIPDPDDPDIGRSAVFGICTPTADLGFVLKSANYRSWAANMTERL